MSKRTEAVVDKATVLITNKRSRSIIFLILSFIFILAINSVLPLIEGGTQYTVEVKNLPYTQYRQLVKPENAGVVMPSGLIGSDRYKLTWKSEAAVSRALSTFNAEGLTDEEYAVAYEHFQDNLVIKGNVYFYTKFFFQSAAWYMSTVVSMFSAVILFYALFNFLITRAKDTYQRYLYLNNQLIQMSEKLLNPETFEDWMDQDFNVRRKVQQHRLNIKAKIDRLERRTSYKVKRTYRDGDYSTPLKWYNFQYKAYVRQKLKLLSFLDDHYIQEYVVSGKVKHFVYIHPMFVYNGSNGRGYTTDSYSLIRSDAKRLTKDSSVKILMSITLATMFAAMLTFTVTGAQGQGALWIIINIIVKIAPLLLQVPLSIDYANTFMDEQLIANLIARRSIGLLHLSEMRGKHSLKDVQEIINEEVNYAPEEDQHSDRPEDSGRPGARDSEQAHSPAL